MKIFLFIYFILILLKMLLRYLIGIFFFFSRYLNMNNFNKQFKMQMKELIYYSLDWCNICFIYLIVKLYDIKIIFIHIDSKHAWRWAFYFCFSFSLHRVWPFTFVSNACSNVGYILTLVQMPKSSSLPYTADSNRVETSTKHLMSYPKYVYDNWELYVLCYWKFPAFLDLHSMPTKIILIT